MPFLVLQLILAVTIASGSLLAATVESEQQSGNQPTTEDPAPDPEWAEREERAEDYRNALLRSRKTVEPLHAEESALRTEQADGRRTCRERIRRANRDQRFPTLLDCLRSDLSLTAEIVRIRTEAVIGIPGTSATSSELLTARADLLHDAIATIIDAIDAGVYTNEEDLLEARNNLREKYVMPYWSLFPRMRMEQGLAGIAHLLLRSQALRTETTFTEETEKRIAEAEDCLLQLETAYETALQESHSADSDELGRCIELYRAARTLYEADLRAQEASETEELTEWEKRRLMRSR